MDEQQNTIHLIQPKKTIYLPVYVVDESEILKGKNIVIMRGFFWYWKVYCCIGLSL